MAKQEHSSRGRITRVRGLVIGAVFAAVIIGILASTGWGTLSAFGIGDAYLLCPLGSLEVMLGAHAFILRAAIALAVVVVLVVLLGKSFCAWGCPAGFLSRFFVSKKEKAKLVADQHESAEQALSAWKAGCAACGACASRKAGGKGAGQQGGSENGACAHEVVAGVSLASAAAAGGSAGDAASANAPAGEGAAAGAAGKPAGKRHSQLDSRHFVLLGALGSTAIFGFPVFCLVCPIGLTFATVIALVRFVGFNEPSWGLLLFPAIIVIELVVLRRWCHTLCPVGALMSLLSRFNRTLRPRVDEAKCLRTAQGKPCATCAASCPELIDPRADLGARALDECTRCGKCVEACPAGAITFTKRKS